jgi:hypothetical protein
MRLPLLSLLSPAGIVMLAADPELVVSTDLQSQPESVTMASDGSLALSSAKQADDLPRSHWRVASSRARGSALSPSR